MKTYFIHDPETGTDHFFTPETDQLIPADRKTMDAFISVRPDFKGWQGQAMDGRSPESLGIVVASRADDGDVCIKEASLWQQRMMAHLGTTLPGDGG